jgi:CheY-like chemotaxis protein
MTGLGFDILHVDDDEIDRKAVRRALRDHDITCNLVEAGDGLQALDVLHERYVEPSARPFIILLDINMPRMGGLEFLDRIRSDSEHARIKNAIVFVFTTSAAAVDLERAYSHNIAGYVVKSDYESGTNSFVNFLESYSEVTVFP